MHPNENPEDQKQSTAQWNYTSGKLTAQENQSLNEDSTQPLVNQDEVLVSWSASEFVEHDKTSGWYITLAVSSVILAFFMFLITRQILSVIVVLVMAAAFAVYGSTKPRSLNYTVTPSGLQIGDKVYPFNTVKSFCIIGEGGMPYVQLLLQKRLSVPIVAYAAPDQIDHIAEVIGRFVPYDQKKRDIADKISSRIRF